MLGYVNKYTVRRNEGVEVSRLYRRLSSGVNALTEVTLRSLCSRSQVINGTPRRRAVARYKESAPSSRRVTANCALKAASEASTGTNRTLGNRCINPTTIIPSSELPVRIVIAPPTSAKCIAGDTTTSFNAT